MRNGVRFRGGGRAQVPSLPVDGPLTSDEKGICVFYTRQKHQCLETVVNLPFPDFARMSLNGRFEKYRSRGSAGFSVSADDRFLADTGHSYVSQFDPTLAVT